MFWFVKTVHQYSAGPESKTGLSYVNVFAYMGRGLEVLKCFVRGDQNSTCFVCVCVCVLGGGGASGSVSLLP